jgi:CoA:oxalate CoA-transferase
MSVTGQPDGKPTRVGTSIGDITAGLFTAIGVNAALYDRKKTGKGCKIDVSMLDCQIAILENAIARYFSSGEIPKPMGSRHPSITPFEAYKTKDSYIIIAAGNDKLFENLCNTLQCGNLFKDRRYINNKFRNQHADDLKKILEKHLIKKKTNEWLKIFTKKNIPCGPIYNIKQAVENPQIKSRNMIVSSYHKKIGKFKMAGNPIKFSNYQDSKTRGLIPDLDQHRTKLLKEFKIKKN